VDGNYFRVVTAGQAMVIAVGALFLMQRWLLRESGSGEVAVAALMLLVVLVLQHRSVWGAVIFGLLSLVALQRQRLGRSGGAALWVIIGVLAVLVPLLLLGVGSGVQQSVGGSVQEALSNRSTFTGRVEGWRNLLSEWSTGGVRSYVMGQPFGSGYARQQQGYTVLWTPHNYYLHVLLRTGVAGLLAFMITFVVAGARLFRARDGDSARWVPILLALVLLELAFFVPYSALIEQAIFCGMALSVAARLAPRAASAIKPSALPVSTMSRHRQQPTGQLRGA
jgi:O-antigen ligase